MFVTLQTAILGIAVIKKLSVIFQDLVCYSKKCFKLV